jgi:hypothetical protein
MNNLITSLPRSIHAGLIALLTLTLPLVAQAASEEKVNPSGGRAVAMQIEAEVTAIDLKTREVTLRGPLGIETTLVAPEKVIKLEDVKVGDHLVGTYIAALEGEVRVPTAEELADPWQVQEGKSVTKDATNPGVEAARIVRAVVTIEGVEPTKGVVAVMDSRGKKHVITGVDPAKLSGVTVGQKAVIVFSEGLALTLQKQVDPAHKPAQ